MALRKLAMFVMDTYKESKRNTKEKPLVISVRNCFTGTTLVVAVMPHS